MHPKDIKAKVRLKVSSFLRIQSKENIERKSKMIASKVLGLDKVTNANSVALFLPKSYEVSTNDLIHSLNGKKLSVPVMKEEGVMQLVEFNNSIPISIGKFQVPEPKVKIPINYIPDVIIVPAVSFDFELNRLGHGLGVYDRQLSKLNSYKIGVAFDFQIVDNLPHEPHDIKMDLVITENRIFS